MFKFFGPGFLVVSSSNHQNQNSGICAVCVRSRSSLASSIVRILSVRVPLTAVRLLVVVCQPYISALLSLYKYSITTRDVFSNGLHMGAQWQPA